MAELRNRFLPRLTTSWSPLLDVQRQVTIVFLAMVARLGVKTSSLTVIVFVEAAFETTAWPPTATAAARHATHRTRPSRLVNAQGFFVIKGTPFSAHADGPGHAVVQAACVPE